MRVNYYPGTQHRGQHSQQVLSTQYLLNIDAVYGCASSCIAVTRYFSMFGIKKCDCSIVLHIISGVSTAECRQHWLLRCSFLDAAVRVQQLSVLAPGCGGEETT